MINRRALGEYADTLPLQQHYSSRRWLHSKQQHILFNLACPPATSLNCLFSHLWQMKFGFWDMIWWRHHPLHLEYNAKTVTKLVFGRPYYRSCLWLNVLSVSLSVGRSVCPEDVLWQNGWLDLDVVWGSELGRSRDGCMGWRLSKGKSSFGVNVGYCMTNGTLWSNYSPPWGVAKWLFSNYFVISFLVIIMITGIFLKCKKSRGSYAVVFM